MKLLIDTSTGLCKITLVIDGAPHYYEWQADRELARGLIGHIEELLAGHNATFTDLTGIGVYRGPGSYTGLRIGATVVNTIAGARNIPIVGSTGESWTGEALERLDRGESDTLVLPKYGGHANITTPRK